MALLLTTLELVTGLLETVAGPLSYDSMKPPGPLWWLLSPPKGRSHDASVHTAVVCPLDEYGPKAITVFC